VALVSQQNDAIRDQSEMTPVSEFLKIVASIFAGVLLGLFFSLVD